MWNGSVQQQHWHRVRDIELQRWVDATIAFRSFETRAKNLSIVQCLRLVHRDYTGADPDPHAENRAFVFLSLVELVLARKGDDSCDVRDCVSLVWQELTETEAPRDLVRMAARSVWLAQDERRTGGRYGDRPLEHCKGSGFCRDEISPWQENAIRAMEDGSGDSWRG